MGQRFGIVLVSGLVGGLMWCCGSGWAAADSAAPSSSSGSGSSSATPTPKSSVQPGGPAVFSTTTTLSQGFTGNPCDPQPGVIVKFFLIAVVASHGAPSTPTGSVTFVDNGAVLGTAALVAGKAELSPTNLPGQNSVVATYGGATQFAGSHSEPLKFSTAINCPAERVSAQPSPPPVARPSSSSSSLASTGPARDGSLAFVGGGLVVGGAMALVTARLVGVRRASRR